MANTRSTTRPAHHPPNPNKGIVNQENLPPPPPPRPDVATNPVGTRADAPESSHIPAGTLPPTLPIISTTDGALVTYEQPRSDDPPRQNDEEYVPEYTGGGYRDYSSPYDTDTDTSRDDNPRRRRRRGKDPVDVVPEPRRPLNQGNNQKGNGLLDRIVAHEAQIQKLKADLAKQREPRRASIINLDGTPSRRDHRQQLPKNDPTHLLPLGDPDEPTPPFTQDIMDAYISRRFKMPTIKSFDGMGDPANHIRTFSNALLLQLVSDAIKCRAFPQTLGAQPLRHNVGIAVYPRTRLDPLRS